MYPAAKQPRRSTSGCLAARSGASIRRIRGRRTVRKKNLPPESYNPVMTEKVQEFSGCSMANTTRDAAVDEFRLLPVGLLYEHCTLHGEQQQQLLSSMPAYASQEHLEQGICDLREWGTLEQHVRHTFNLPPTHAIQMEIFLGASYVSGVLREVKYGSAALLGSLEYKRQIRNGRRLII